MSSTQVPPVPDGLREMLKAYPSHIECLQEDIVWVIQHPSAVTPPFERAIWVLEGRIETFISEARHELQAAEDGGDSDAIAQAGRKLKVMLDCSSRNVWKARNLLRYFDDMEDRSQAT